MSELNETLQLHKEMLIWLLFGYVQALTSILSLASVITLRVELAVRETQLPFAKAI